LSNRIARSAYFYVLLGASLWGTIGLFVDLLYNAGFTAMQIVALRVTSAAIMLVVYLALKKPTLLKIDWKDLFSFVGTGIFSIVLFNWSYFSAIEEVSLSIAVILLYTGPIFVTLLSWLVFNEKLTTRKLIALCVTILGCALVIKVIPAGDQHISLYGFAIGLLSGFSYALYSIFGKFVLQKYESLTVITYTFVVASLFILPFIGTEFSTGQFASGKIWMIVIGLGLIPTVIAYLLYTMGLSMIESSRASIAATVEPLVATIIGVVIFNEVLSAYQLLGMVLVLMAVIMVQFKRKVDVYL